MQRDKHILDNRRATVVGYLREQLRAAEVFRLVSAYFTIYGYGALQSELRGIGDVRFLFGDPASVGEVDPGGKQEQSFALTEGGLSPNLALSQKWLARQCADWVRRKGVKIRSVGKSNFLHGKMYLAESAQGRAAVVGSSNFTRNGLGGGTSANVEINLATRDAGVCAELRAWFDDLWADEALTVDVKRDVLAALNRIGEDHAPEFIYFKTLYELFRADIEERQDGETQLAETHLYDTEIWNALYGFQKDGAKSAIARLLRHNGCILADSVGLGKTYTALAAIKFFELRNERVLVLCPKKLRENWALYPVANAHVHNPFPADRFGYTLLSHTDLSRNSGRAGDIDLAHFNWRNFDLVVIDESHNFRNDTKPRTGDDGEIRHSRYSRLLEEVIEEGTKTKVLMLSATPVNTSLIDLRNQIYLMTEKREDVFRDSLGIGDIGALLAQAQRAFKAWETKADSKRDKSELAAMLGADFFGLLGGVSIARSRRQIEMFYAEEMDRIGKFPAHQKPENAYPKTDLCGDLSYQKLSDQIGQFALSIYRPSSYVTGEEAKKRLAKEKKDLHFNQADRERFLIGMMRTNFLKRLESSAHSLAKTLGRTVGKIDDMVAKIDRYAQRTAQDARADILPDDDEDDEEFLVNRARTPYHLRELDLDAWKRDLQRDRAILTSVWERVKAIDPQRDGKLRAIAERIRNKARNPTRNRDGKPNRKMLVFTTFKDTARYLYDNLTGLARELNIDIAMVSGDETHTSVGDNDFNAILTDFAPVARNRGATDDTAEIDLLIATDCISEGQNLQDCDTVLNYDIHWNPVRLIQRLGRVDRIGSRNPFVQMINYWPTRDMDVYLRLQHRVEARMALADAAASGDDDPLREDAAQTEINFRDEQLKKLREEVVDFDALSDGVVMSDFTFDYFFAQLLRYLEKNKAALEAMPNGVYAITRGHGDTARPGAIFFFRQRDASADRREKAASPVHPYYAVYVRDSGDIRYGCAHARQVLELFESVAVGKTEPLQKLCDQFDHETQNGRDMTRYNRLLDAVMAHISGANKTTYIQHLGLRGPRDFKLPAKTKAQNATLDFELVTWLVITV